MVREVISSLLKKVEPKEVVQRRRRGFHRRHFWAAGVNDVWPQDQHNKWGRFGLWMHAGIEAFSGEFNWLRICGRTKTLGSLQNTTWIHVVELVVSLKIIYTLVVTILC